MAGKSHLEGQLAQSPRSSLAAPSGPSPPGCAVSLSPQVDSLWRIRSDREPASLLFHARGLPRDSASLQALPSVMEPWGRHSQRRGPRSAGAAPTAWPGTKSPVDATRRRPGSRNLSKWGFLAQAGPLRDLTGLCVCRRPASPPSLEPAQSGRRRHREWVRGGRTLLPALGVAAGGGGASGWPRRSGFSQDRAQQAAARGLPSGWRAL